MTEGTLSNRPPYVYPEGEPVDHTEDNWRKGRIAFDLSGDEDLADAGDEEAMARLKTARILAARRSYPAPIANSAV